MAQPLRREKMNIRTQKLTQNINQALRCTWVMAKEQERLQRYDIRGNEIADTGPVDELIKTVEQFLADVKATRNNV